MVKRKVFNIVRKYDDNQNENNKRHCVRKRNMNRFMNKKEIVHVTLFVVQLINESNMAKKSKRCTKKN